MKKLNFGCGSIQPQGWVNIDNDPEFRTGKTTAIYQQHTFDIIVAHASIQQIEWHKLVGQLRELHRVLKPGGVLRISLPDIVRGFQAYRDGDIMGFFPNAEKDLDDRFSAWLTWYSTSKTLMTSLTLINKLIEAGFSDAGVTEFKKSAAFNNEQSPEIVSLDTRRREFFFVEARK